MPKTLGSKRYKAFIASLIKERKAVRMTQKDVAKALGQYQSFMARVESGQRRVDVIEFLDIAEIIGFDPKDLLMQLQSKRR